MSKVDICSYILEHIDNDKISRDTINYKMSTTKKGVKPSQNCISAALIANTGRKLSKETIDKIKKVRGKEVLSEVNKNKLRLNAIKGQDGSRKQLIINGVFYKDITTAAETYELSNTTVTNRAKSNNPLFKEWNFINAESKNTVETKRSGGFKKAVSIMGKIFPSITLAATMYEVSNNTVTTRINSNAHKWKDWNYVDTA